MTHRQITDPNVQILAGIATMLEPDYVPESDPWKGSPFAWIQTRPSRQKGAIGEALVSGWAAAKGCDVKKSPNSDADKIINGHRIEIKYSNLWTNNQIFKFQQIRNQDYDYVFCLGLSPFDAQAWFIPKAVLMGDLPEGVTPQHGGSAGTDTRWLSFPAAQPPHWMDPFGGRMQKAYERLLEAGHGPY